MKNSKTLVRKKFIFSLLAFFILYSNTFVIANDAKIKFTENKGQVHDQNYKTMQDVLYSGTDGNLVFHLKNKGISYQLNRVDNWEYVSKKDFKKGVKLNSNNLDGENKIKIPKQTTIYRLDLNWLNSNNNIETLRGKAFQGYNNYYLESCPNGALNVQSFEDVTYKNIYNGIDVKLYEKDGNLKYDYIVAAGANYKNIQLQFIGATAMKINGKGELVLLTPLGELVEQAPIVFQNQKILRSQWIIKNNVVSFNIENLNPNLQFVIDPMVRVWGTYYGANFNEEGNSCSTDATGNVYMAGFTTANNGTIIATSGAHQTTFGGGLPNDAFLVKFNAAGVRLWGTYYGGSGNEEGNYCTTDVAGNVYLAGDVYIAGQTTSTLGSVIATPGAHQIAFGGNTDQFLAKFNSNGVRQWSTYYGGAGDDFATSCTVDAFGNVYLAGHTSASNTSATLTTAAAHQTVSGGFSEGILVKFNSNGVRQWGTYYGGTRYDYINACTTDANGNVYIAGQTSSLIGQPTPITSTAIATLGSHQAIIGGGTYDAFLVKFSTTGVRLWGTYYGGVGIDQGFSCATDAFGNVYLSGSSTTSTGLSIATQGAHQSVFGGLPAQSVDDAFLVKFTSSGVRQWGTYFGGAGNERGYSCATDSIGNVYMAGMANPTTGTEVATAGAHQTIGGGGIDGFLVKFNALGVRQWGSYYGDLGWDWAYSCAADNFGNVYLAGYTDGTAGTSIATAGAHQIAHGGGTFDSYLVKFFDCTPIGANISVCNNTATLSAISGTSTINWYATPNSTVVLGTGNSFITPTLGIGTYTYYVESLSCNSNLPRTAITLTVYNNANPTITVNSGSICSGDSFTINPSGANTYTIQGGSTIVSPSSNTSYTVIGSNSVGCVSPLPATSNITVSPLPTITVLSSNTLLCVGESATINASGAVTLTFNPGGALSSITVAPTVTTIYTVSGTDLIGCSNSTSFTQSVSACSNIEQIVHSELELNVYPNPFNKNITVISHADIKSIQVFNVLGALMLNASVEKEMNVIDLSHLSSGVYYMKVGNVTKKIVKE
jgi:hypothetical protein